MVEITRIKQANKYLTFNAFIRKKQKNQNHFHFEEKKKKKTFQATNQIWKITAALKGNETLDKDRVDVTRCREQVENNWVSML